MMVWVVVAIIVFRILFANRDSIGRSARSASASQSWLFTRGRVTGHAGPTAHSFKGRAGRREWWIAMIWNGLVGGFVGLIPVIGAVVSLPWLVASWAATARRLHDLKRSAWLQVPPMAIMGAALAAIGICAAFNWIEIDHILTFDTPLEIALVIFAALAGLIYFGFYAWLGFTPGAKTSNYYGEADLT